MRWFLLQVKPTTNSYTNNLNNQVSLSRSRRVLTRLSLVLDRVTENSCQCSTGWAGATIIVAGWTLLALWKFLSQNGNGLKKFLCKHTTHPHPHHNSICDKFVFADNMYRNLSNCYHHPAGSFTTISAAIANIVYRHTCLMPVQMQIDTCIHVCVCKWFVLFLFLRMLLTNLMSINALVLTAGKTHNELQLAHDIKSRLNP